MGLSEGLRLFGLSGTVLISAAALVSSIFYRGRRGERYSPLNHFISELGELGISPAARVFNLGLTAGGLLLVPFMVGLGMSLNSVWGWLGTTSGIVAAVSAALVGVFPMNNLTPHVKAAMTYFRSGLVLVILIGLAILFQPAGQLVLPHTANLLSLLAIIFYASFLLLGSRKRLSDEDILNPLAVAERPRVWLMRLIEWLVFFSTMVWIFGIAVLS